MLQLKNVNKSFPGLFAPVLQDFNFELKPGEVCMLLGSNGCGKSTLLKLITGEYPLDKGEIYFDQQNLTRMPFHQRARLMQCVTQDIHKSTIAELTLLENLVLGLKRQSIVKAYRAHTSALKELIASYDLGLEKYLHTPLAALSGGQRQLIAILMSTLTAVPLLLFDEHCSALDPNKQQAAMELTCHIISQRQCSALMITHNLRDAIRYGNRLILLRKGQIILDVAGTAKQKLTMPQLIELFHEEEALSSPATGESYASNF